LCRERFAVRANARAFPLAADPHIGLELSADVNPFLPPPLRHLRRIDKGLENTLGLRRYVDFAY
jgi:hypothetical protein